VSAPLASPDVVAEAFRAEVRQATEDRARVRRQWSLSLACEYCGSNFTAEVVNRCDPPKYCSTPCRDASIQQRRVSPVRRFWRSVDTNGPTPTCRPDLGPCWQWKLKPTIWGYGRIVVCATPRKAMQAHRFSFEMLIGPVPDGLELDHLCRNRMCVKPTHLEPVPPQVNKLRGESPTARNARKTHCKYGHDFSDPTVLILAANGKRKCRVCRDRANAARHPSASATWAAEVARAKEQAEIHLATCRPRRQGLACSLCYRVAERLDRAEARLEMAEARR
jgi:hypothetical protein